MSVERVTLNQRFTGRVFQNVFHLFNSDGLTTPAQIADEIRLNWIAALRGHQAHGLVYESITIQRVDQAQNPAGVTIPFVDVNGDGTNTLHHASICALFSFRTNLAGRRFRGRYYMATLPFTYTQDDVLGFNGMPAITGAADLLKARYASGGSGPLSLVIFHRDDRTFTPVTDILASNRVGIQRRRNVGVGI